MIVGEHHIHAIERCVGVGVPRRRKPLLAPRGEEPLTRGIDENARYRGSRATNAHGVATPSSTRPSMTRVPCSSSPIGPTKRASASSRAMAMAALAAQPRAE
jgi:hypothetical protein